MRAPGRSRTSQRRVLAGILRPDGSYGRPPDARTLDDVRTRHAFLRSCPQADRLGEAGKTIAGTGCGNDGPLLQLRCVQSGSRLPPDAGIQYGPQMMQMGPMRIGIL